MAAAHSPDRAHLLGHGREAYVWSLLAALGLFVAGAAVSVAHGIQELLKPVAATAFVVGYAVLGVSFVPESISFLWSVRQTREAQLAASPAVAGAVFSLSSPDEPSSTV